MRLPFVALMFIILFSLSSYALGVGPVSTTISYTGQQTVDGHFYVFKQVPENLRVGFTVQGELAPHLTLYESETVLRADNVRIPFRIEVPAGLSSGQHEARIIVQELKESGGTTTASVALPHKVQVDVAHPGKHLNADVAFDARRAPMRFVTKATNTGTKDVSEFYTEHTVYENRNKLFSVLSESARLDAGQSQQISATLPYDLGDGIYEVASTIFYDKESMKVDQEFSAGDPTLTLDAFSESGFVDDINKLRFTVSNHWNQNFEDIHAEIIITYPSGDGQDLLVSEHFVVLGRKSQTIYTYWDTQGKPAGSYPVRVILHGPERKFEGEFLLELREKPAGISGIWKLSFLIILAVLAVLTFWALTRRPYLRQKFNK